MEVLPLPVSSSDDWSALVDQALGLQRQRVREFLALQRERLRRIELELAARFSEELESARTAARAEDSDQPDGQDWRALYEMSLEDVRRLTEENAALQQQIAEGAAGSGETAHSGSMSWEAEKQRVLAALEGDGAADQPPTARPAVSRPAGGAVAGAAPSSADAPVLGAHLDADAVLQQEREKIAQLRRQWEEKLRQAEVDLSLERAKLARQQAEINEKLRTIGDYQARPEPDPADKLPKGRWRAVLGLKDNQEG